MRTGVQQAPKPSRDTSTYSNMNILFSGADGNLGSAFQTLAAAHGSARVTPLTRTDWSTLDEKLDAVDLIVHAASDLRTQPGAQPQRWLESNLMSTARLLEAARQHGVKRYVFISSCAVYGANLLTHEDSACSPITSNGIEKHLNEKLVAEFCANNGIEYLILRVFNTYGGKDRFSVLSKLENAIRNGTPFTLNNDGRVLRDFIHVDDVAAVVLHLCFANTKQRYVNIGTGVATKIADVVGMVVAQFPQLIIQRGNAKEVEYSRADTTLLRQFWGGSFVRIEDYVRDHLISQIARQVG